MSLKHGLLGILNYSNMTGYELAKSFNDSLSFFWQAQTSQIYRELNKMEEMGFLNSQIEVQTDKPNKRIYSITQSGKTELQNWLKTEMPVELMPTRSEVLLRLFFSAERPITENIEALKHIVKAYQSQIEQFNSINDTINEYKNISNSEKDIVYWNLTAEFGRLYNKMCMEWAKNCIEKLEDLKE